MKVVSIACALILSATSGASAQDPATVDAGHYRILIDNARTRVFHVLVGPGEKVPTHAHPDAIMVPLNPTRARDGSKAPDASFLPAQTHGGGNDNTTPIEFIYIELKSHEAPTATPPANRPGLKSSALFDHPKAAAIRATAGTDFIEPGGTTYDFDQVLVALGDAEFSLTVGGKTTSKWKRGDVAFIGRNVKYESKNTGKPFDYVIVAIK
jgi:hypothetical protein